MLRLTPRTDITLQAPINAVTSALESVCKHCLLGLSHDATVAGGHREILKQMASILMTSVDQDSPRLLQQPTPREWKKLVAEEVSTVFTSFTLLRYYVCICCWHCCIACAMDRDDLLHPLPHNTPT